MRILRTIWEYRTVFPAVAVEASAADAGGAEPMTGSIRRIFALMVVPVLLWAPLGARAETSSIDLTLLLSTGIGSSETAPMAAETATGKAGASEKATGGMRREMMAQVQQPQHDPADTYRIDTGDGISITVYGEPDLSLKDERVKGSGKISYPLLGDIEVRGRTASELQRLITEMLADGYLKKPNVTVSIDTFRLFYIKGEVRNPGGFNYVDGLTVEKAVALAGGYTERASERNITVVRDGDATQRARRATPGMRIGPGDVITVGESFF
jgi:hypothetical protein